MGTMSWRARDYVVASRGLCRGERSDAISLRLVRGLTQSRIGVKTILLLKTHFQTETTYHAPPTLLTNLKRRILYGLHFEHHDSN